MPLHITRRRNDHERQALGQTVFGGHSGDVSRRAAGVGDTARVGGRLCVARPQLDHDHELVEQCGARHSRRGLLRLSAGGPDMADAHRQRRYQSHDIEPLPARREWRPGNLHLQQRCRPHHDDELHLRLDVAVQRDHEPGRHGQWPFPVNPNSPG